MEINHSASCAGGHDDGDDGGDSESFERDLITAERDAQRELDRCYEADARARSDYHAFLCEDSANKPHTLHFSYPNRGSYRNKLRHLTRRELLETRPDYVSWFTSHPCMREESNIDLQNWLKRGNALSRRMSIALYAKQNAELLARAFDLKPTVHLRKSTARGQLCEMSGDAFDCVVRSMDHLHTYLRFACTCKTISQALRPMRVDHVVALGLSSNGKPSQLHVNRVRIVLRIPPYLRIEGAAEMTKVGRLVECGLRRELKKLADQMNKQVAQHIRRRANLRRATTAVEYGLCNDKRLTEAAGLVRKALADVQCTTSTFNELRGRHALRFQNDVPTDSIRSEETMSVWSKFMRCVLM
jgi:hypothetical protein